MSSLNSQSDFEGPRVRPGALTLICVLAIVFGALGLLAGLGGLASQIFTSRVQQAIMAAESNSNLPGADIQKEIVTRTMDITKKYNVVILPLTVVKILVEVALLVGGIMSLGLNRSGRSWLNTALAAALVFEAIQFVPRLMVQRETQAVMAEMMPRMMAAQTGPNGVPPGFNTAMTSGIGTATLIFGLVWLVAKIVLYLIGMKYLRKPEVVALFEPETA